MAEEHPNTDLITLTRCAQVVSVLFLKNVSLTAAYSHILSDQIRLGDAATGDLTLLLNAIQTTSKFIATNVRKARLINL